MVRWMLAAFVASFPFVACSSSSENKSAPPCTAGATRNCVGPGQCAGAQSCETDRTWTPCDCGSAGTGGVSGSSGTGGAPAGGTSGSAGTGGVSDSGLGGSGGVVSDAAPDGTDLCAAPASVTSCKACCENDWPFQFEEFKAAFWTCACSFCSAQCLCDSGGGTLTATCNACLGPTTVDVCVKNTCPSGNCEEAGNCFDDCYTAP